MIRMREQAERNYLWTNVESREIKAKDVKEAFNGIDYFVRIHDEFRM